MSDEDDKTSGRDKTVEDGGGNIVSNTIAEVAFNGAIEIVADATKGLVEAGSAAADTAAEMAGSALDVAGDVAQEAVEIAGEVLSNIDI